MSARHPLPTVWLMTDDRLGARLCAIAARLPPGSGIVLRQDDLPPGQRWRLARRLARIATARRLVLFIAGRADIARRWGAAGVHMRQRNAGDAARARRLGLLLSMPVHDRAEARRACRAGAAIVFVSPLYPTRSHPAGTSLSDRDWTALARLSGACAVALGGMDAARARLLSRKLAGQGITPGWAAIDAWLERDVRRAGASDQKRNCVPT